MSDELDQLSDAALSERFAVEVAEIKPAISIHPIHGRIAWFPVDEDDYDWRDGREILNFAASADAVLPMIFDHCKRTGDSWRSLGSGGDVLFSISPAYHRAGMAPGMLGEWIVKAPTFARAACIALLRAKRAEKGTP